MKFFKAAIILLSPLVLALPAPVGDIKVRETHCPDSGRKVSMQTEPTTNNDVTSAVESASEVSIQTDPIIHVTIITLPAVPTIDTDDMENTDAAANECVTQYCQDGRMYCLYWKQPGGRYDPLTGKWEKGGMMMKDVGAC